MVNRQLSKSERLNSQLVIDKLFAGGNASMVAFPLRIVYMRKERKPEDDEKAPPVSILISVPKKRFRHAVDRNRMKRMVREAYRVNKHILWEALAGRSYGIVLAFICIADTMPSYHQVEKRVIKSLSKIAASLD
ncbi:MAG: ribonuclease P protein component [Bacteroidales bacterium]|nr:ribonuclease P protein component [Bacteroidales bacterium]